MKAMKYLSMVLLMLVTSVCMFSCSSDDDGDPTAGGTISIVNQSTETLERFTVTFLNERMEILTQRDYGTFLPGDNISAEIPTGAAEYYMGTYLYGMWFFSPNYSISIRTNNLTQSVVDQWTTN